VRQYQATHAPDSGYVQRHQAIPVFFTGGFSGTLQDDSSVIEQDIDLPEGFQGMVDNAMAVLQAGMIRLDEQSLSTQFASLFGNSITQPSTPASDDNMCALAGK